jgi:formylglycine-generating enzyme required for sulfatase activity
MKQLRVLLIVLMLAFPAQAVMSQSEDEPQPGDTRVDAQGIEQVWVPAGCFEMGITGEEYDQLIAQEPPSWVARAMLSEQPQHEVCLTSGYWIDRYEVTNAAWQAFVDAGGYATQDYWSPNGWKWLGAQRLDRLPARCPTSQEPDHPRACITWYEAEAYATWREGSLPTEAQWEYAARGPDARMYPWGDDWDPALANVIPSTGTTPVGSYPDGASWIGAEDMAGNVMEWTQDWLDTAYYTLDVRDDPTGPETGRVKVERGGWWGGNPFVARTTYRHFEDPPSYGDMHIGVRIVSAGE